MLIDTGDIIRVDGIVVKSHELRVTESKRLGGRDNVSKMENEDMFIYSGSKIMEGSAEMIVLNVGMNTLIYKTSDN